MIKVKKINILEEIEVPYSCDTGFGSDYDAGYHNMEDSDIVDIKELVYDDNYILGEAVYGDQYDGTATRFDYSYSRNAYITNGIASKYNSQEHEWNPSRNSLAPGYCNIVFEKDMLALVGNKVANDANGVSFTGDAYCIKSIHTLNDNNRRITMVARSLMESDYQSYHLGTIMNTEFAFNYEYPVFFHSGKSGEHYTVTEAAWYDMAQSNILTWVELRSHILSFFSDGAIAENIINYINENMQYGGIVLNPFLSFYYKDSVYQTLQPLRRFDNDPTNDRTTPYLQLSSVLNPETYGVYYYYYPRGRKALQWIIPFTSNEEAQAAFCAREVEALSKYKYGRPYLPF